MRVKFEFEVALHQLSVIGTKEHSFILRDIFNNLGVMGKLEVVQENELYQIVLPGEFDVTLLASWPELQNTLINTYPEEKEAIKKFLRLCEAIFLESFRSWLKRKKRMIPNY